MIIVEFFGGPGCGKRAAAKLAYKLFHKVAAESGTRMMMGEVEFYCSPSMKTSSPFITAAHRYRKYTEIKHLGVGLLLSNTNLLWSKVYDSDNPCNKLLIPLLEKLYDEFTVIKVFIKRDCGTYATPAVIELDTLIHSTFSPFDFEVSVEEKSIVNLVKSLMAKKADNESDKAAERNKMYEITLNKIMGSEFQNAL